MGIQEPCSNNILYEQLKQSRIHYDVFIARIENKIYNGCEIVCVWFCVPYLHIRYFKMYFSCMWVWMQTMQIKLNCVYLSVCIEYIYCPSVQCQANGHNVAGFTRALASPSSLHSLLSSIHTFNGNFRVLENFTKKGHPTAQIVHCTARIPRWNAYRKEKHSH